MSSQPSGKGEKEDKSFPTPKPGEGCSRKIAQGDGGIAVRVSAGKMGDSKWVTLGSFPEETLRKAGAGIWRAPHRGAWMGMLSWPRSKDRRGVVAALGKMHWWLPTHHARSRSWSQSWSWRSWKRGTQRRREATPQG